MTKKANPDAPVFSELQARIDQEGHESYIMLPPETLEGIAKAILEHKGQMTEECWTIGRLLIAAKEKLTEHGEWLCWLAENVDIPEWQAERYMKLAREYPNPTAPSILGLTKALALTKIPNSERDTFLKDPHPVDGQEKTVIQMTTRELEKAIREWKAPKTDDSDDDVLPLFPVYHSAQAQEDDEDTLWDIEKRQKLLSDLENMQEYLQPILEYLESMEDIGNPGKRCTQKLLSIHDDIMNCLRLAKIKYI